MGKISKLDLEIFLLEVFLTVITCGFFLLIKGVMKFLEYRERVQKEKMERAEALGRRANVRAMEWVMVRQEVWNIKAERCKTTS